MFTEETRERAVDALSRRRAAPFELRDPFLLPILPYEPHDPSYC